MRPGSKIKERREALGLSQHELGRRVGIRQQSIKAIEDGVTQRSRHLPRIASVLGLRIEDLDPDMRPEDAGEALVLPPSVELMTERDLPVYSSAEGGNGAMILSVDPIEYVGRPTPLVKVRDGYGLIIVGESMQPQLWPGDLALIHPHLPATPGSAYVFYSDDGHGVRTAVVKWLLRVSAADYTVRQWNPPEGEAAEFRLDRARWTKCHRVIGVYGRR